VARLRAGRLTLRGGRLALARFVIGDRGLTLEACALDRLQLPAGAVPGPRRARPGTSAFSAAGIALAGLAFSA